MDPFFSDASLANLLETAKSVLLVLTLVALAIFASEKAFGLNIKEVVNAAEELMQSSRTSRGSEGNPWPAVALLIGGLAAIVFLVR